ncbi:MAG TPA: CAP domain-containing protein [Anaerolineales bacterium]|nr:CAP domain-containing protein [Anaerolineales bacterium]
MNTPLRRLIIFLFFLIWILSTAHVLAGSSGLPPLQEETTTTTPEASAATHAALYPVDIINAINDLRIRHGMSPLAIHSVLMEVAAQTANALAATEGMAGHYRPCNMSLGQLLLTKGFALWGDLSQDGYRSENWGIATTAQDAISMWLGDDEHANTMLSPDRSHIGAAVVASDQMYVVVVTALQTPSGQMQWGADAHLTKAAATQSTCLGLATQYAEYGSLPQYSVPVALSTARSDGDVIHEVQYGQTLWTLAITYGTTIEQIKRLNNLTSDIVMPGWTLLIVREATQPAPATVTPVTLEPVRQNLRTPTLSHTPVQTEIALSMEPGQFIRKNSTVVVALVISFSVLVAAIVGFGKKKE